MTTACTVVVSRTIDSKDMEYEDDYLEQEDEEDDDDALHDDSESQLFSPPPRSWFEQDYRNNHHVTTTVTNYPNNNMVIHNNHIISSAAATCVVSPSLLPTAQQVPSSLPACTAIPVTTAATIATFPLTSSITLSSLSSSCTAMVSTSPSSRQSRRHHHHRIAAPQQAPSWQEVSCRVLPAAAKELVSTCLRRMMDTAHRGYVQTKWTRKYSDLGNNAAGYRSNNDYHPNNNNHLEQLLPEGVLLELPPFSSLPWIDRQLVQEWRTFEFSSTAAMIASQRQQQQEQQQQQHRALNNMMNSNASLVMVEQKEEEDDDDDDQNDEDDEEDLHSFDKARALVPKPLPRPTWQCAEHCFVCYKPFGPTRLRHHCRLCGNSYCQYHSSARHALPHLGYDPDLPERVCDACKSHLLHLNHVERVAWRLARCRDLEQGQLTPYFETGVDTLEQAAWRVAKATLTMVKSFPMVTCVLGTSATVAVETLDVLRQYGIQGIYGILLRREFLAAADLLRRALGINRTSWPLSVHELTAAIFYALAQHRAMRGLHPDQEHVSHSYRQDFQSPQRKITLPQQQQQQKQQQQEQSSPALPPLFDPEDDMDDTSFLHSPIRPSNGTVPAAEAPSSSFTPVCDPVSDALLGSLLWYAPLALKFIYAAREVDIQLLAAQQGWRLLYAHLEPEKLCSPYEPGDAAAAASAADDSFSSGGAFWEAKLMSDRPASAMLVHQEAKIACLVIRGTTTIQDVVTDIRQTPIPFPTEAPPNSNNTSGTAKGSQSDDDEDWTAIFRGQGLAVCGMANAALNLFRDHVDVLTFWAQKGYRIRITGHSLGGGVAALMGVLLLRHLEELHLVEPPTKQPNNTMDAGDHDLLRVYAYGTPSCVDGVLSDKVKPFVTTVVLHDDVVPRMTPTSIRGLLKHLLFIRETWVKAHLTDDLLAITERAKTAWAPKWRGSFTLRGSTPSSIQRYCRKQIRKGTRKLFAVAMTHSSSNNSHSGRNKQQQQLQKNQYTTSSVEEEEEDNDNGEAEYHDEISETSDDISLKYHMSPERGNQQLPTDSCCLVVGENSLILPESGHAKEELGEEDEPVPRLLLDYMGGIDCRTKGIVIDGDEFFDTDRSLILEEDEESSDVEVESEWRRKMDLPLSLPPVDEVVFQDDSWDATPSSKGSKAKVNVNSQDEESTTPNDEYNTPTDEGTPAVVLEELPLPRMYLPGQVVHIYSQRGVFRAAIVPRNFRELRRISMAGNMLSDHTSQAYYNALLEVQSVRDASEAPPRWAGFDEDDTCACCASRFTWASTSDSKAQEARDKHNCRSCGSLVCDPCSQNRIPLPSIGITVASRVCDRCYNDTKSPMLTQSGLFATARTTHVDLWSKHPKKSMTGFNPWSRHFFQPPAAAEESHMISPSSKPERQRERRSAVVDELASRIPSSSSSSVVAAPAGSSSNSTTTSSSSYAL